ncbi:MAG: hypothetical protein AB3N63_12160 [Puniceicoccaceae bacterium]
MKFNPTVSLKALVIWGLIGCPNAIIAGTVGKDFMIGPLGYLSSLGEFFAVEKETVSRDDYLEANVLPKLVVGNPQTAPDARVLAEQADTHHYFKGEKPTLKEFLAYLEQEGQPDEAADSLEDDVSPDSLDEAEQDQNNLTKGESLASGMYVEEESPKSPHLIHNGGTASLAGAVPIFPRPYVRNLFEENLFLYFPVEEISPEGVAAVAIGSLDAIFHPPQGETLMSTATITIEP